VRGAVFIQLPPYGLDYFVVAGRELFLTTFTVSTTLQVGQPVISSIGDGTSPARRCAVPPAPRRHGVNRAGPGVLCQRLPTSYNDMSYQMLFNELSYLRESATNAIVGAWDRASNCYGTSRRLCVRGCLKETSVTETIWRVTVDMNRQAESLPQGASLPCLSYRLAQTRASPHRPSSVPARCSEIHQRETTVCAFLQPWIAAAASTMRSIRYNPSRQRNDGNVDLLTSVRRCDGGIV
jgi:hypothetical protein